MKPYRCALSLQHMTANVLHHYGLDEKNCLIAPFGNGLINLSWKITSGKKEFLLQQINQQVFRNPPQIMQNLAGLDAYLNYTIPIICLLHPYLPTQDRTM